MRTRTRRIGIPQWEARLAGDLLGDEDVAGGEFPGFSEDAVIDHELEVGCCLEFLDMEALQRPLTAAAGAKRDSRSKCGVAMERSSDTVQKKCV